MLSPSRWKSTRLHHTQACFCMYTRQQHCPATARMPRQLVISTPVLIRILPFNCCPCKVENKEKTVTIIYAVSANSTSTHLIVSCLTVILVSVIVCVKKRSTKRDIHAFARCKPLIIRLYPNQQELVTDPPKTASPSPPKKLRLWNSRSESSKP